MRRAILVTTLASVLPAVLLAQTAEAPKSFEVASIKPAAPQGGGRFMVGMRGGPGTYDPGQITYNNVSLRDILMAAYGVKRFQITGPDWMDSQRFDIVAKSPKGATKDDLKPMLQNLLAERFKLALHHESKEMQTYALVVSKRGLKMKESVDDPAAKDAAAPGPAGPDGAPPPPPPGGPAGGPVMSGRMPMGKDGFPQLPAGRPGMMAMITPRGMRVVATKQPISGLANLLGNQLNQTVIDMTGLKGTYDFTLDFAPDENMRMMGPVPMGPPPPGGEAGGGGGGAAMTPDAPNGPSLFTALEEQLGLKLEPKKGPVDILIVDRVEKTPTEN